MMRYRDSPCRERIILNTFHYSYATKVGRAYVEEVILRRKR